VVSTEDARERAFDSGAISFVGKPIPSKDLIDDALGSLIAAVQKPVRRVLVLAEDDAERSGIAQAIGGEDVSVRTEGAGYPAEAVAALDVDCLVLDAKCAFDLAGLARALEAKPSWGRLPVLVWGAEPDERVPTWSLDALTIRHVQSRQRLTDLAAFFLHRRATLLPEAQRRTIEELHRSDAPLEGRRVLVVDDDVRNIFALASVLEEHGMTVLSAKNGREALQVMGTQTRIDIVLMDIMMPDMDGIATMREARRIPGCKDLPIIAVTAKAMKGDRERCIEAGAWDYLSKPVDPHHLLAALRSWLYR
jgi:CheY-like chemotaxis protein